MVHGYRFLVRREDIKGMREAIKWSLESELLSPHLMDSKTDATTLAYFLAPIFVESL